MTARKQETPGLNDKRIKGFKPAEREYVKSDSGPGGRRGLYLVVKPNGRKLFRARVTVDGETRYRDFSPDYPDLSLASARDEFDAYRRGRRRRAAAQTAEARSTNVTQLLDEWDRVYLQRERKQPKTVRRAIEKDVIPRIGKMAVADVERRDLVLAIDKVVERGSLAMAEQLRSLLLQMFGFAVERGLIDDSPARLLPRPKRRGRHRETRDRILNDEEIRRLWWALANKREDVPLKYQAYWFNRVRPYTKRCIRLLLLTAVRRSEAALAEWSEINWKAKLWRIPAERAKNGREHAVPLSDLAVEILEEQRELTGAHPWVFASPRADFKQPVLASAISQAVNDNQDKLGVKRRFTPHDLRRTVRSRLSSLGVDAIVSRKVLNHTLDGMDRIYDRHEYVDEKRDALQLWADELRRILDGGEQKVVPLDAAGARR